MPDDEISAPLCRKFLLATLPDWANVLAPFGVFDGVLAVTLGHSIAERDLIPSVRPSLVPLRPTGVRLSTNSYNARISNMGVGTMGKDLKSIMEIVRAQEKETSSALRKIIRDYEEKQKKAGAALAKVVNDYREKEKKRHEELMAKYPAVKAAFEKFKKELKKVSKFTK